MIARTSHKRYANAKDFQLFKNGKSLGIVGINEKDKATEEKELKQAYLKSGADKVVLIWTAREGHVNKEVII